MCMLVSLRQQIMTYAWTSVNACSLKGWYCNQNFMLKVNLTCFHYSVFFESMLTGRKFVGVESYITRCFQKPAAFGGAAKTQNTFLKFHNLKFFSFYCLPWLFSIFDNFSSSRFCYQCVKSQTWLIIKFSEIIMKDTLKLCVSSRLMYLQQKWSFM